MSKFLKMESVDVAVESLDEAMRALWPCQTAEMRALMGLLVHTRMRLLQMSPEDEAIRLA